MFNLEGFIPKLCQIAQEVGEDERVAPLRSAALQALSSMVFFNVAFTNFSCHVYGCFLLIILPYMYVIFLIFNLIFLYCRFGSWVDIPIYHQSLTM